MTLLINFEKVEYDNLKIFIFPQNYFYFLIKINKKCLTQRSN